jgi:hypothetical protein
MLRKMVFVVPALLINIISYAQFKQGDKMTGASVGSVFFNNGNADQTVTSIGNRIAKVTGYGVNIIPSLGWFISENTAFGFSLYVNPSGDKVSFQENGNTFQKDKATYFNIGLGGFVRNYFRREGSLLPFGQFNFSGGMNTVKKDGFFYGGTGPTAYKETYETRSSDGSFADAIFTLGITKMFGQYTGLDLSVGYNFSHTKNTTKTTRLRDNLVDGTIDETAKNETLTKYTTHKFILGLGFQIFLERKKK